MHVVAAMDKFRGTLTAAQACAAVVRGVTAAGHHAVALPLSDGGEGFLDAFGGPNMWATVTGPQGIPVRAGWRFDGTRATIEAALACGLALRDDSVQWDALTATSRGVGELIDAALGAGAREIWVGVGGTGCTDGGSGALAALRQRAPSNAEPPRTHPSGRPSPAQLPTSGPDPDLSRPAAATTLPGLEAATSRKPFGISAALTVLTDVTTHFADAATIFGPQKGASASEVEILTERLKRLALTYAERFARHIEVIDGSGAGGGLAGGLAAIGGDIRSGFDTIATATGLDTAIAKADLVITGEGHLDLQSLQGKVVGGVLRLAATGDVPAVVIAGDADANVPIPGDVTVHSLVAEYGAERAWRHTASAVTELARHVISAGL